MQVQHRKQPKWKSLLPPVLWSMVGIGLFILLVSASGRNEELKCTGLEIAIDGYKHEMFISESDVKQMIEDELLHTVKGCRIGTMKLRRLENSLQKDNWVSKAQLFIDNQQVLHVNISERLPVARIFTRTYHSFYIDSNAVVLPLSMQQVADVPVFTNLPDRLKKVVGEDSILWNQLGKLGNYIISDSFLLLQVGQVNITEEKELEIFPVIGNHVVLLGKPENFKEKLKRLKKFDQQVLAKAGINKYSRLDLRYNKQIVATLRGESQLPEPQLNISPDVEQAFAPATALPAETAKTNTVRTNPVVTKPAPAPTAEKVVKASQPSTKQNSTAITASSTPKKTNSNKPTATPNKIVAASPKKITAQPPVKIVVASSNKPVKKPFEQQPKKSTSGIVEIDSRQKQQAGSNQPKAVMPKKNSP